VDGHGQLNSTLVDVGVKYSYYLMQGIQEIIVGRWLQNADASGSTTGVLLSDARTWQTLSLLVVLVRLRSVDHGVDHS